MTPAPGVRRWVEQPESWPHSAGYKPAATGQLVHGPHEYCNEHFEQGCQVGVARIPEPA
jgi:hypothetical protein